mgnify:FL=1
MLKEGHIYRNDISNELYIYLEKVDNLNGKFQRISDRSIFTFTFSEMRNESPLESCFGYN